MRQSEYSALAGSETFVKTLCKLVGAALELPYDVLIKEFNSSYSASRGALLEAWEAFKMRRKWFVDDFCQPVYEMFLAEAVALGRINAPGFFADPLLREAWCGARWIGPVQGSLDPKKEAEAALMLIDNAIKTHEQVSREMSGGELGGECRAAPARKRAAGPGRRQQGHRRIGSAGRR
ncbi:MAG: phage portal protein [Intestinimonas sp.]